LMMLANSLEYRVIAIMERGNRERSATVDYRSCPSRAGAAPQAAKAKELRTLDFRRRTPKIKKR